MIELVKDITLERLIVRLIASLCLVSALFYLFSAGNYGQISYLQSIDFLGYGFSFLLIFLVLSFIFLVSKKGNTDLWAMLLFFMLYAIMTLVNHYEFFYAMGVILLLSWLIYYVMRDDRLKILDLTLSNRTTKMLILACGLLMFVFIASLTTLRYLSYHNSTFDFGIFSQMFYYMKKTGLPMVTCERDRLLSHFAVHVSPIYYLLLPVYFIFPSPITLQVMQAVIVSSGLIPLYLIGKHYQLSNKVLVVITFAYAFYPALIGGTFYDIHENKFLTPLILWLFYFFEKKRYAFVYLFALLVLFVKEDAPLYIAVIGLYMLISKRAVKQGCILFVIAVGYFFFVLGMLSQFGEGAMIGRYNNYMTDPNDGLLSIFKTIFLNPAYLLYQVFTLDKMKFMLLTLMPLAFLPLLNKHHAQFILLIPYLVMNLMSNYIYQYSINFQYTYGVSALFFYLVVLNVNGMSKNIKKYILPFMVLTSILLFTMTQSGRLDYLNIYKDNKQVTQQINEGLSMIPSDASVEASGYFVPKLSQRDIIYNQPSKNRYTTDYVVLDLRPGREANMSIAILNYKSHGYSVVYEREEVIIILKSGD